MSRRKSFELGVNANAVYMNYLGYSHEDGMIISETLSNKLAHYSIIDTFIELYPDDIVRYIKKIGSKVTSKDTLVNSQTRLRVNSALKDTFTGSGLLGGMGISYNQNNLIVPNNIDEGYIIDVKVEIHPDRSLTSEITNDTIAEFNRDNKVSDYEGIVPKKYKELKANTLDIRDRVSGYISYKILRVDRALVGDKLANRYGGKGIISLVLPDKCMPQIVKSDGTKIPTEIILNPGGVLHRKNLSQIYECALSKCIVEIFSRVSKYIMEGRISDAKKLLNRFYGKKFDSMTDDDFIKNHNQKGIYAYKMEVGFYSTVSYDTVIEWMKILNVSDKDQIYCPDIVIHETKDGIKGFLASEVNISEMPGAKKYDLGFCEQPCITGHEYMLKLWKQAKYDGKVTSEVMNTDEPIMGKGNYRWEGQKIGEMETWILLETGTEKFLTSQSDSMLTSQYVFLNELLLSGYYIQDPQGSPVLSQARSRAKQIEELGK
jgi:DNA-directed RNA polymerase beta subunit